MDEEFRVEDCGVKVEIGDNLLKAIRAVLKKAENANIRTLGRTISPGKEVQKAFGLNLAKMYKRHVKNKQHNVLE